MNPQKRNTESPSHQSRRLVWLLTMLLLCMPYLELTKAASVVEEMPCHEQMVLDQDEECMDCGHDPGASDCRCCGLDSPASMLSQCVRPVPEQFQPPIRAGRLPPDWLAVSLPPPYRPPIAHS